MAESSSACAHKRVSLCLIYTHLYTAVCTCGRASVHGQSHYMEHMLSGRQCHWHASRHNLSSCFCFETDPDRNNFPLSFPPLSDLGYRVRPLANPATSTLTFLRVKSIRGIPAEEFEERLKTAKLGSVTGNLQGLVLADKSVSTLSTREGFTLISIPLLDSRWLWESLKVYPLQSAQESWLLWRTQNPSIYSFLSSSLMQFRVLQGHRGLEPIPAGRIHPGQVKNTANHAHLLSQPH